MRGTTAEKTTGKMAGSVTGIDMVTEIGIETGRETVAENTVKQNPCGKSTVRMKKDPGIDGILVTVGLCIIALLLCVVMKDSLAGFIETIVEAMTDKANTILNGVGTVPGV